MARLKSLHRARATPAYNPFLAESPQWLRAGDLALVRYRRRSGNSLSPAEVRVRELAYALKTGEREAVATVAPYLAALVTSESTLIPMPDSKCDNSANLALARAVAKISGASIDPAISRSQCVRSQSQSRAGGGQGYGPEAHHMIALRAGKMRDPVCLDNVITTGSTVEAARRALRGKCRGLAWASEHRWLLSADALASLPPEPWTVRQAIFRRRAGRSRS